MKTLEQVLSNFEDLTLDGRQSNRLSNFLTVEQAKAIGIEFKEEYKDHHQPKAWTRENILAQLEKDVAFGFQKGLDKRGLSAGMMFEIVYFWNTILEEGLEKYDKEPGYAMYGLPLFKATAVKYGWPNPIGEDKGSEAEYDEQ